LVPATLALVVQAEEAEHVELNAAEVEKFVARAPRVTERTKLAKALASYHGTADAIAGTAIWRNPGQPCGFGFWRR
jgi:hypothetical protein